MSNEGSDRQPFRTKRVMLGIGTILEILVQTNTRKYYFQPDLFFLTASIEVFRLHHAQVQVGQLIRS